MQIIAEKMNIADKIAEILERCKTNIQASMESEGVNASGRTSRSLQVERYEGGVRLVSRGQNIAPFISLERGNPPMSEVPANFAGIIYQWSIDKGLQFSNENERYAFAYLASRKIVREGTQRFKQPNPNVYSPAVSEAVEQIIMESKAEIQEVISRIINR